MHEESDRLQPVVVETRRGMEQMERIKDMLARVELTNGLTLSQLVVETMSRLPRDATVVAILAEVSTATALVLANLKRRGYTVTAILILLEENALAAATGLLLAENIDVRHVRDEATLSAVCQQQVLC